MYKHTVIRYWAFIGFFLLFALQSTTYAGVVDDRVKENIDILKNTKACPQCDLKGAVLNRMDLSGVNLQGADLRNAKFFLTNLSGANLKKAHLQRAAFGGADLAGADLRGADLTGADLSTAYLVGVKLDGEFIKTKPYQEEGSPELEKKTYLDDTVRPKSIERIPAMSKIAKHPEQARATKKTMAAANEEMPKPLKPANIGEKLRVAETDVPNEGEKPQIMEEKKDETIAPPIKTVEPIKQAVVGENAKTSKKEKESTTIEEKDTSQTVVDDTNQEDAVAAVRKGDAIAIEEKTEPEKSELKTDVTPSEQPAATGKEQPTSVENEKTAEPGSTEQEKAEDKALVATSPNASKMDQEIIEKDILSENKDVPGQETETGESRKKEQTDDKTKNLQKLLEENECYHCDLSGVDLSGKSLDEADLEGADLTGCNLEGADLSEAILKGAILVNANLKKADLREADLYKADCSGADLTGAKLEEAKIDDTNFTGAKGVHEQ